MSIAHTIFRVCVAAAFASFAIHSAHADSISFNQNSSGHVIAQLSGNIPACETISANGVVAGVVTNTISVYSSISSSCTGPGPFEPLVPFDSTVDLGVLGDENYTLNWSFVALFGPVGGFVTSSFSIRQGVLVMMAPIPAMSTFMLVILAILLLPLACLALGRP